jgi:hypothetical protein
MLCIASSKMAIKSTTSQSHLNITQNRYSDAERAAVYRAIYERRDIRHFLPDPVDPEIL